MRGVPPTRVAPFGHPRITGCQRLPGAFRRVAASFIGRWRPGIHRAPIPVASRSDMTPPAPARDVARAPPRPGSATPLPSRTTQGRSLAPLPLSMCLAHPGGAAGSRTPDLRRAKAALSQLSYGPRPVGAPGLEPGASALSGPRSDHLSYAPSPRHWTRANRVGALAPKMEHHGLRQPVPQPVSHRPSRPATGPAPPLHGAPRPERAH